MSSDVATPCKCSGTARLMDSQSWTGMRLFDEKIRFKVVCPECGSATKFYNTMEQAESAWDIRSKPQTTNEEK